MSGDFHGHGLHAPLDYEVLIEYEQLVELEQRKQREEKAALEAEKVALEKKQAANVADKLLREATQQFCEKTFDEVLNMIKVTGDGRRATAFKYAVAWVNHKAEDRSADFDKIMKELDLEKLHEENPELVQREFNESSQGVLTVHGSYIFSMYRKLFNAPVAHKEQNPSIAVQTDFQVILNPLPLLNAAVTPPASVATIMEIQSSNGDTSDQELPPVPVEVTQAQSLSPSPQASADKIQASGAVSEEIASDDTLTSAPESTEEETPVHQEVTVDHTAPATQVHVEIAAEENTVALTSLSSLHDTVKQEEAESLGENHVTQPRRAADDDENSSSPSASTLSLPEPCSDPDSNSVEEIPVKKLDKEIPVCDLINSSDLSADDASSGDGWRMRYRYQEEIPEDPLSDPFEWVDSDSYSYVLRNRPRSGSSPSSSDSWEEEEQRTRKSIKRKKKSSANVNSAKIGKVRAARIPAEPKEASDTRSTRPSGSCSTSALTQSQRLVYIEVKNHTSVRLMAWDTTTGKSDLISNVSVARSRPTLIGTRDGCFLLGGSASTENDSNGTKRVDILKHGSAEMKGPNMRSRRKWFPALVVDNFIYVVGGAERNVCLKACERLNWTERNSKWVAIAALNTERAVHALVFLKGKLYAIGGQGSGMRVLKSVEEYDFEKKRWSHIRGMRTGRTAANAVVLRDQIFVVGGFVRDSYAGGWKYTREGEVYSPSNDSWSSLTPMHKARAAAFVGVVDDKIFVVGGERKNAEITMEVYDPDSGTWSLNSNLGKWSLFIKYHANTAVLGSAFLL